MDGEDAVLVRLILRLCLVSFGLACLLGCEPPSEPPVELAQTDVPQTMLWTWERPEDLSFLADRDDIGVAHLVATVELRAPDRFVVRPNRNPIRLPDDLTRIAVVRIENVQGRSLVSSLDDDARSRLVGALAGFAQRFGASGLQLDFDAVQSQRAFYAQLLVELRPELPHGHSLGITALASWCMGDPWLGDLPASTLDYVVPMLFRMGADASKIRRFVEAGGTFTAELCRGDVGWSTDESWPAGVGGGAGGVRRWVFHPAAWDGDQDGFS